MEEKDKVRKSLELYIRKHADIVNWEKISIHSDIYMISNLSEDFSDDLEWTFISRRNDLTEEFITKNADKILWNYLHFGTKIENLSEQFLIRFENQLNWFGILNRQELTEEFIEKYQKHFCWKRICQDKQLSEECLRRNIDKLDWHMVAIRQCLSESFIEDFADKFEKEWNEIVTCQRISMKFIKNHLSKLKLSSVIIRQKLSRDQILELTQTREFLSQLKEGLLTKDPEWEQFKYYYYIDDLFKKIQDGELQVNRIFIA